MKILICPNAMKGSLNAVEFANAIEEGLLRSGDFEIEKLPVADGGDGMASILATSLNARIVRCNVLDPLGKEIESGFFINENNIAIIEMASASGLHLLKVEEYSPLKTTSYGTGQLIQHAIASGAKTILLGVGGSATVDAGMGALIALGVKFYNGHHQIENGVGATMCDVVNIDFRLARELFANINLIVLCDVENPMVGENGAARAFAAQKGASLAEIKILEKNLALFAGVLFQATGKDVSTMPKGGSAGAIAASLYALFDAKIVDGAAFILEKINFFAKASKSDLLITGEGKLDSSSLDGKATGTILHYGMKIDKPVIAFCGHFELTEDVGFDTVISLVDQKYTAEFALKNAYARVVEKAEELGNKLKLRG